MQRAELSIHEEGEIMLGERIKTALFYHDMSQKDLAEKIGVTEATMCRWCKNERSPKANDIIKICRALHISADWLLELM